MHLDPAKSIILKCGGFDRVAKVTSRDRSRVYRWTYPESRGGTGGVIPRTAARKLLADAEQNRIALDPSEFMAAPKPARVGR